MFTRKRFLAVLVTAISAVWLIGSSAADAQKTTPNPVAKAPAPTVTPTPSPTPEDEVIKVDTDVVNVLFTAQDRNRRLLTDLKQADIRLLEDGKAQEMITFSRQVDLPLSLASLIAASTASVPLLQKNDIPSKSVRSPSACARSACGSVYHVLGTWMSVAT